MIFETIITTQSPDGQTHVAPFGIQWQNEQVVISPYKPSVTMQNILSTGLAVMNVTDDVRVFAFAIAREKGFPLVDAEQIACPRLAKVLAHHELVLQAVLDDAIRPQLIMQVKHSVNHTSFKGFNRAQAAVIELAVLISRLNHLPIEEITTKKQFLQVAIDRTAGEIELEAWQCLLDFLENHIAQANRLHLV